MRGFRGGAAAAHVAGGRGGGLGKILERENTVIELDADEDPDSFRMKVRVWYLSDRTQYGISVLIFFNFIIHGLNATSWVRDNPKAEKVVSSLDYLLLWTFVLELSVNMWTHWFMKFWEKGWNIFDFVLIWSSVVYFFVSVVGKVDLGLMAVVPVLRTLRIIKVVRAMRRLTQAMLMILPEIVWVLVFIFIIMGIYSIMGVHLYRELENTGGEYFFTKLTAAMYTLFQMITFDSWASAITRPYMEEKPASWIFMVSWCIFSGFVLLQIITAIFLTGLEKLQFEEREVIDVIDDDGTILGTVEISVKKDLLQSMRNVKTPLASARSSPATTPRGSFIDTSTSRRGTSPTTNNNRINDPSFSQSFNKSIKNNHLLPHKGVFKSPHGMIVKQDSFRSRLSKQGSLSSVTESLHEDDLNSDDEEEEKYSQTDSNFGRLSKQGSLRSITESSRDRDGYDNGHGIFIETDLDPIASMSDLEDVGPTFDFRDEYKHDGEDGEDGMAGDMGAVVDAVDELYLAASPYSDMSQNANDTENEQIKMEIWKFGAELEDFLEEVKLVKMKILELEYQSKEW